MRSRRAKVLGALVICFAIVLAVPTLSGAGQASGLPGLRRTFQSLNRRGARRLGMAVRSRPGYTVVPGGRSRFFEISGSNGYRVAVYALGRNVVLDARSKVGRVEFEAKTEGHGRRIKARFGHLGFVNMRFLPASRPKITTEPQGDCRGRRALVQPGRFRGVFRWHGEGNFSSANARTVEGLSVHSFREVCKGANAGIGNDQTVGPSLVAKGAIAGRTVETEVFVLGEGEPGFFTEVAESTGALKIRRFVSAIGGSDSFTVAPSGAVSVAPPKPFFGTAEALLEGGSRGTWTGDLSAEFPGVGRLVLAGPQFYAHLPGGAG